MWGGARGWRCAVEGRRTCWFGWTGDCAGHTLSAMSRLLRYWTTSGKTRWGQVEGDEVRLLDGDLFRGRGVTPSDLAVPLADLRLAPPVAPSKIVCVGRNYAEHAAELDHELPTEPLLFLKPPSCLIGHGQSIVCPTGQSDLVHHEGELAVVIGRRARRVRPDMAKEYVLGYTIMNDVTARDIQRREGKFTRAKGFDTFGPLGPWIDTEFEPVEQVLTVRVNGEMRQQGAISLMVFDVPRLIADISHVMTLEPGDVISTGTPSGVGPLVPGDRVEVTIEGLGTLDNDVVEATT